MDMDKGIDDAPVVIGDDDERVDAAALLAASSAAQRRRGEGHGRRGAAGKAAGAGVPLSSGPLSDDDGGGVDDASHGAAMDDGSSAEMGELMESIRSGAVRVNAGESVARAVQEERKQRDALDRLGDDKEAIEEAKDIAAGIDLINQPDLDLTFGADVNRTASEFADDVLRKTSSRDSGHIGEMLQSVMNTLDAKKLGAIRTVPILGTIATAPGKLRRRYQNVSDQIGDMCNELERHRGVLEHDIEMFDAMYATNADQYRQVVIRVVAGRKALNDFNRDVMPKLEEEAQRTRDMMQAQALADLKSRIDRFAKRVDDLDRIALLLTQSAPQIRIIQNADRTLIQKIETTITTTVPLWKSQIVIALGLQRQQAAASIQKRADDLTNRMIQENAKALHQGAIAAEKANQRAVIDMDSLEVANREIIDTLRDIVKIQRNGRGSRAKAEEKLERMRVDLHRALVENSRQLS